MYLDTWKEEIRVRSKVTKIKHEKKAFNTSEYSRVCSHEMPYRPYRVFSCASRLFLCVYVPPSSASEFSLNFEITFKLCEVFSTAR